MTKRKIIKWKPVVMTRENGTTYVMDLNDVDDPGRVLREIVRMPKQKPVGFADGYRIIADHIDALAEEGGDHLANWLNENGYFPEGLKSLGYHVEIKESDFEIIKKAG